jgi:prevent-host-death family protein
MIVSANDIKTKGVTLLDKLFESVSEVVINVRGKNKYVVIDIERYKQLRELELDRLYEETMQEIKEGRYTTDVEEHLKEVRAIANGL